MSHGWRPPSRAFFWYVSRGGVCVGYVSRGGVCVCVCVCVDVRACVCACDLTSYNFAEKVLGLVQLTNYKECNYQVVAVR